MTKTIIKLLSYLLIFLLILIFYLSYFGIKTQRFNGLIEEQILAKNEKIKVDLEDIKILLDLKNISFNFTTKNPEIIYDKNIIKLNEIKTNFAFKNFFNKNFILDNLYISTHETKIKEAIKLFRAFKNSPELLILNQIVKDGYLLANINLNFDKEGKIKNNYQINGFIKKTRLSLLNKEYIDDVNFNFQINYKKYLLEILKFKYIDLEIISKFIKIEDKENYFLVNGNFENNKSEINSNLLSLFFKKKIPELKDININSKNNFQFKLDKKFKINDFNLESNIDLNKIIYNFNIPKLKKYLPESTDIIKLDSHKINLIFAKKKLIINGKGNFSFDDNKETIEYRLENNNDNLNFELLLQINNNPILIDFLDYKKISKIKSYLNIKGTIKNNNEIIIQNVEFVENENKITLTDLNINKYFKIQSLNKLHIYLKNNNKINNQINLIRDKKGYKILGESFDAGKLIESILNDKNDKDSSFLLDNLNTTIKIDINKTYLDNSSFINNLRGKIIYKNNKIDKLDLKSTFPNDRNLTFSINTNDNNEKITTLFAGHPKPLVDQYKFIKGFEEGVLDFQSISKNDISNSVLKIDNFKVKEVPSLAKLLSLASLQGIADLLTGEGIRFTDFEMIFSNSKDLMTIKELYAIGPAISIMVDGYIADKKLISLRGTLVPARTINRTIASIPIIGDLLVGKKVGEGVFGVSFKIKGPPKDLKTSVNPIKTLTPRFITRTLEKIKKN